MHNIIINCLLLRTIKLYELSITVNLSGSHFYYYYEMNSKRKGCMLLF